MVSRKIKQKNKSGGLNANLDHSKAKITHNPKITHNHHGVKDSILRDLIQTQKEEIKFLMERNRELADRNNISERTIEITLVHLSRLIDQCVTSQKSIKNKLDKLQIHFTKK